MKQVLITSIKDNKPFKISKRGVDYTMQAKSIVKGKVVVTSQASGRTFLKSSKLKVWVE